MTNRNEIRHLPPKLQRLLEQVQLKGLHRGSEFDDPRAWLINWLYTPDEDLNGHNPARFLDDPDCDLILVGLLIRKQTRLAWGTPAQPDATEATPASVPDPSLSTDPV